MNAQPFRWAPVVLSVVEAVASLTCEKLSIASEQPQVQTNCGGVPIKRSDSAGSSRRPRTSSTTCRSRSETLDRE